MIYDIAKLPEEKNTEKFFDGYNKRIDLIKRLQEDLKADLNELEPEVGSENSEGNYNSNKKNLDKPPTEIR